MKKVIIILGLCFLITNVFLGCMLTRFHSFNILMSCLSIILTAIFLLTSLILNLKDGYRISFLFLFTSLGIVQYILSVLSPNQFSDNWYLLIYIIITVAEIVLLVSGNAISNKTMNSKDED